MKLIESMEYNFNDDMHALFKMLDFGDMRETLVGWLYNIDKDQYEFNEKSFFYVLYDICNYDFISIYDRKVNIEESNEPEVAKIVARWATQKNIDMVYERIYE